MRSSFTPEEVMSLLSRDHRMNTAYALRKPENEVTADELVDHWVRFHPMGIQYYHVEGPEDKELGLDLFETDCDPHFKGRR